MAELAYVDNDNILQLKGLQDINDNYINDAIVTLVTVNDNLDVQVTGQTFPVSMGYVAASNGVYQATMEDTLLLTHQSAYVAKVDVNAPTEGLQAHFELDFVARTRKNK